jgi:LacI family transcriptional regulator
MSLRPAIGTVATQARVSVKTVSRVLNNSKAVSAAMRNRVMTVIRELNYSPSPTARRLAGHRSRLVGLPFDGPYASYVTDIQSGSMNVFRATGYQAVMHACDSRSASVVEELRLFIHSLRVDGILLTPPLSDLRAVTDLLRDEGVPYVSIAPATRSNPRRSVFTNDREACCWMVRHLHSQGHRRIGYVIGHPDQPGTAQRHAGYCDGLIACGLQPSPQLIVQCDSTFHSAIEAARSLLDLPAQRRPTAICAGDDTMAAGVLRLAHELQIDVPGELSIAGFGDEPLASQVWPRLTTIRQPLQALAQQAAVLLMQQLLDDSKAEMAFDLPALQLGQEAESSLVLRQSTGRASSPAAIATTRAVSCRHAASYNPP